MAVCPAPSPTTNAPVVVFRNSRRANPPGVSALFLVMSDMASLPPDGPEHIPGIFNGPYLTLRIVILRACASFSDQKAALVRRCWMAMDTAKLARNVIRAAVAAFACT